MDEKKLTSEQSIEIIDAIVKKARKNVVKKTAIPFLTYGYSALIISLLNFFLFPYWGYKSYFLWFILILVGVLNKFLVKPQGEKQPMTNIEKNISMLWIILSVNIWLIAIILHNEQVLPILLMLLSIGTFMTGYMVKFNFLKYCSLVGLIVSYVTFSINLGIYSYILFGIAIAGMYIVPAHYMICNKGE